MIKPQDGSGGGHLSPRRKRSKLLHCVPQFSQIIIAALFCAALFGYQKAGRQKSGQKNHGFSIPER